MPGNRVSGGSFRSSRLLGATMARGSDAPPKRRVLSGDALALAELEALARAGLAVDLALDLARIAREVAGLLQSLAKVRVIAKQRPADAMAHCLRLGADAAAGAGRVDVERCRHLGDREGRARRHAVERVREIVLERAAVDGDGAGAGAEEDAGARALALARAVVLDAGAHATSGSRRPAPP